LPVSHSEWRIVLLSSRFLLKAGHVLSRRFGIWMFKIDHSGENLIADDFGRSNIGSRRNQ
jgi:hypothetical protein